MQLSPVLLTTDTRRWHRLCREPDESNSTGIRFDSLGRIDSPTEWFESIIPSSNCRCRLGNNARVSVAARSLMVSGDPLNLWTVMMTKYRNRQTWYYKRIVGALQLEIQTRVINGERRNWIVHNAEGNGPVTGWCVHQTLWATWRHQQSLSTAAAAAFTHIIPADVQPMSCLITLLPPPDLT